MVSGTPEMEARMRAELDDLQFHWGEAYEIGFDDASGVWSARYQGSADQRTGCTVDELRQSIRADYQAQRRAEQRPLAKLEERSSEISDLIREDNEGKQRGLYVGYSNGKITRPSRITEDIARRRLEVAKLLINATSKLLELAAIPQSPELLANREAAIHRIVHVAERDGRDAVADMLNDAVREVRDELKGAADG
jgi:AbiV